MSPWLFFVYNLLQNLLLLLLWPVALVLVLSRQKYRRRAWSRCGFGLARRLHQLHGKKPRFWFHALSVGEVSSVVSLVAAIRNRYPEAIIFFSTTTASGADHARKNLNTMVDCFVPYPWDHFLVVRRFWQLLRPDVYIQVETDFWPNFLAVARGSASKLLLVNGRISAESFGRYEQFSVLWHRLFNCFDLLAMQTAADAQRLTRLGIAPQKLEVLGNLKIDAALPGSTDHERPSRQQLGLPAQGPLLVAGSTHRGEERLLLEVVNKLRQQHEGLALVLALRNIERGQEVAALVQENGLQPCLRSTQACLHNDNVLIVDTLGELLHFYHYADLVFVGGSLVAAGGHNPLEPAAFGRPVSCGPHMEDFTDIVTEMVHEKALTQVQTASELADLLQNWLNDSRGRQEAGQLALAYVHARQGVTNRHVEKIDELLA